MKLGKSELFQIYLSIYKNMTVRYAIETRTDIWNNKQANQLATQHAETRTRMKAMTQQVVGVKQEVKEDKQRADR